MTSPKEILFEDEARSKLQKGMHQAAEAVRVTLGPKGRNVCIESGYGDPKITSDGHSILQEIELACVFENMGVSIAKEAAAKMKEICGDGTTTTTLLLDQMVFQGNKFISAGASPISLKRGMEKAIECITSAIEKSALAIKDDQQIRHIAQVSSAGNRLIGQLISEAIEKVGREGVITIDESRSNETTLEIVEGLQFDRGYISPYFVTSPEKMIAEYENPYILITDRKIGSLHDILPLLQSVAASTRPLVIIAEDVEAEALSTLVVNHMRGILKVVAIKAPGFGDRRKAMLEDLAIVTGAELISEAKALQLQTTTIDQLGTAQKISVSREHTTILAGDGAEKAIAERIAQIDREISSSSNKFDKEKLVERKAKLKGGIAVIRVGGSSEGALKNLKQKFEDSLNSTRAAIESGVVIGAGMSLAYNAKAAQSLKLEGDEKLGSQIVQNACLAPAFQIVDNAGHDGRVVVSNLLKKGDENYGFDCVKELNLNLMEAGIIDAAKVVKQTLIYAASSASIILLSEALIADAKDEG